MSESPFDPNDLTRDVSATLARLAARGAVFTPARDADRFDASLPDEGFGPDDSRLVVAWLHGHAGEIAGHIREVHAAYEDALERLDHTSADHPDSRPEIESARARLVEMRRRMYPIPADYSRVVTRALRLLQHRPAPARRRSSARSTK